MKSSIAVLSVATLSFAILAPALAQQENQAAHMVPARASLTRALEANRVHEGDQFRATLSDNVHLNSGVELRHGDTLIGKVVTDDTNSPGASHLAVRFTQAVQKNGQTIPIKATIVSLTTPGDITAGNYMSVDEVPNSWNDGTLRVDQIGVVKDVDLHSSVSSENSGVFVSTKKADFKLPAGSEIALAISVDSGAATPTTNSGS